VGVRISAADAAGAFRAGQILRQLSLDGPSLPCLEIRDAPRFPWRGLMLDCCRHFMDPDYVKATIDRIALHGLNRFHWHLTEDQGWRLEIPSRPRLTTVGAVRAGGHGGFYTADAVREVVAYAAARHVTVVPEIEMPGHCRAALAAYPELSCRREPLPVETGWGVFEDVYCAGDDAVFDFLFEVLEETLALFPSPWIHVGGDEVPRDRWRECPRCLKRVDDAGLDGVDALQSWFLRRVEAWLAERGRTLVGWDEILEGGLPPRAIVQSWRGFEGAQAAARAGHASIVSPTSHAYFDYPLERIDLERVYGFEPVPEGVDPARVLGGEANMWTERAPRDVVDARIWPRLLAMAERLWVPGERRDFDAFRARVAHHYARLDALGVAYGEETA
jgi:hexosaminidase